MDSKPSSGPKVSIWSITYNHAPYIKQCLDGILSQQTDFDFELIIGDDASTDGTSEILKDYAAQNPDIIKPIFHDQNIGIFENSIVSVFSKLTGDYVAICEGDDYWTDPNKLQKQIDFLEANKAYVACYHRCTVINEKEELVKKDKWGKYKDHSSEDLLFGNGHLITSTVLFRNVIQFPEESRKVKSIDTVLWHLLGFHGAAKFLDSIQPSIYRIHQGGIWSLKDGYYQLKSSMETYSFISNNLKSKGLSIDPIYRITARILDSYLVTQLAKKNVKNYLKGLKVLIDGGVFRKRQFLFLHLKSIFSKVTVKLK